MTQTLTERQLELEAEMVGMGVHRYRQEIERNKKNGEETGSTAVSHLLRASIEPLACAIIDFLEDATLGKPGRGRTNTSVAKLRDFDPDVAAYIISRTILDQLSGRATLTAMCIQIGSRLEDEARFRRFEEEQPGLYKYKLARLSNNKRFRRAALRGTMRANNIEWKSWAKTTQLQVGRRCFELFADTTGIVTTHTERNGKQQLVRIVPTEKTMRWIAGKDMACELLRPVNLPMLVPPAKWTSPVNGGYLSDVVAPTPMVKTNLQGYLRELANIDMPNVYDTLNSLQDTGYTINTQVLEVQQQVKNLEWATEVGIVPSEPMEVPGELPEEEAEDKDKLYAHKRRISKIKETNARRVSKCIQHRAILSVAEKFKDEEAIYFPHDLDFRGRIYPKPGALNPQGCDAAKGLLLFAEGKALETDEAWSALAIHGANVFGEDKVSLADRRAWVLNKTQPIVDCANDPLTNRWWTEADKPWQFLAFCFEWSEYLRFGGAHVSHLPCAVDGTANGLQHLSAIMRDPIGAKHVNMTDRDKPEDIYQIVAEKTEALLRSEVTTGGQLFPAPKAKKGEDAEQKAVEWAGRNMMLAETWLAHGITRKVTKRSVMVMPYGGTLYSTKRFVRDYLEELGDKGKACPFADDQIVDAANYLGTVIWQSIGSAVAKARMAMGWLQEVADIVAQEELPVVWTTAAGFPVQQHYVESNARRVKTQLRESVVYMTVREDTDKVDRRRAAQGMAPNFIHSADAAALMLAVCGCVAEGIRSFAMVHDSYAVLAADMPTLNTVLRDEFCKMYEGDADPLGDLKKELEAILPEGVELPEPPVKGTFDVSSVRSATYFFS